MDTFELRADPLAALHNQRGQAFVEMGIVMILLVMLVGGIMQFGHAFMVANIVTHAARDGARLAASWQNRGGCGQLNNTAAIQTAVLNTIATVADTTPFTSGVTVGQMPAVAQLNPPCVPAGATPTVTVTVTGCVPYIFNILGFGSAGCPGGFHVNRTITFVDELRGTFG